MANKKKRPAARKPAARKPAARKPTRQPTREPKTSRSATLTGSSGGAAPTASRLAERQRVIRKRQSRQRLRNRALGLLVLIVVIAAVTFNVERGAAGRRRLAASLTSGTCRLDSKSDPGSTHVQDPTFQINPPAGGDHLATPAGPGTYDTTVPPEGQLVHSMEHGYVILWYRSGTRGVPSQLRDLGADFISDVLVVARPTLTAPIAATAWHHRLLCQAPEAATLRRFVKAYRNKGPERVPH